jgi:hypothetical protein
VAIGTIMGFPSEILSKLDDEHQMSSYLGIPNKRNRIAIKFFKSNP